MFPFLF